MGAGVKDGGVFVGLTVGLGPGVNVKGVENETVGKEKRSCVFVGPTVKVGVAVGVCANSVKAADNAVSSTITVGAACFPQATNVTVKTIEKHRCIVDFGMIYQLTRLFCSQSDLLG